MSNGRFADCGDRIVDLVVLNRLIEYCTGSTYPQHILRRRFELLSDTETRKVLKNWNKAVHAIEKIDETIALCAERHADPWR